MCTGVGEAQRVVPCRKAKDGRWQGGLGDASGNIQQACAAVCTAYGQESQLFAGDHAGQSRVDGGWLYGIHPQLLLVATNATTAAGCSCTWLAFVGSLASSQICFYGQKCRIRLHVSCSLVSEPAEDLLPTVPPVGKLLPLFITARALPRLPTLTRGVVGVPPPSM